MLYEKKPHPMFNTPLSLMINMSFFKCEKEKISHSENLDLEGYLVIYLGLSLVEN